MAGTVPAIDTARLPGRRNQLAGIRISSPTSSGCVLIEFASSAENTGFPIDFPEGQSPLLYLSASAVWETPQHILTDRFLVSPSMEVFPLPGEIMSISFCLVPSPAGEGDV